MTSSTVIPSHSSALLDDVLVFVEGGGVLFKMQRSFMTASSIRLEWLAEGYAAEPELLLEPINHLLVCLGTARRLTCVLDLTCMLRSSGLLLAWEDQALVGMVTLTPCRRLGDFHGYVDDLVVAPEKRDNGIAKKLIQEVIVFAYQRGMRRLFLLTHVGNGSAQHVYAATGFRSEPYVPYWKKLG